MRSLIAVLLSSLAVFYGTLVQVILNMLLSLLLRVPGVIRILRFVNLYFYATHIDRIIKVMKKNRQGERK